MVIIPVVSDSGMKHFLDQQQILKLEGTNIKEMHKTTTRCHPALVRMATLKTVQLANAGKGVEKKEPSYTAGGV